jgi:hypothetical protein
VKLKEQMEDIDRIVAEIDSITSARDPEQLRRLIGNMNLFFEHPQRGDHLDVWFRLFERFPEEDGLESFWSILHGLEAQPDVDRFVIDSVERQPSEFPLRMVNGMINAGQTDVGTLNLLALLKSVAANGSCPVGVRTTARKFVEYQERK